MQVQFANGFGASILQAGSRYEIAVLDEGGVIVSGLDITGDDDVLCGLDAGEMARMLVEISELSR